MIGRPAIRGSVPAAAVIWPAADGRSIAAVVCKLTFELSPGKSEQARTQDAIAESDSYLDDDVERSLCSSTDLAPSKRGVDVTLWGHAFSPGGRPSRSLVVRLVVGNLDKSIEVLADRSAGPDGTILHGPKFTRMPLVYERAFGGPRTWNPVGIRPESRDAYGRSTLPNLLPAVIGPGAVGEPVGFGPIAPRWPGRLEALGRLAPTFGHDDWHLRPLPEGFDFSYFNVAPPDQRLASLKGGETILLENLHRSEPILSTKVPEVRPVVVARRSRRTDPPLAMKLDTLAFDTDRGVMTMTWRGQLPLERPDEIDGLEIDLESFVGADLKKTQGLESDDPLMVTHDTAQPATQAVPPARPSAPQQAAALPFQGAGSPTRPSRLAALPFAPADPPTHERPATAPPPPSPPTPPPPAWAPVVAPSGRMGHDSVAALAGAAAASNAASDPRAVPAPASAQNGGPVRPPVADILDLVWFDPAITARVKRHPPWKKIIDDLEQAPFDPDAEASLAGEAAEETDDKREVFEILTRGSPSGPEMIETSLADAIRSDGRFAPRLILVAGELKFEFEDLEILKATLAAAQPFATEEDDLKKAVARAAAFLASPGLVVAPDVARGFTQRIRDAFAAAPRLVQASYLDDQTERALLERRGYQRKSAFGQKHLRGEFVFTGMDAGVPTYLADDLAKKLPLFRRFRVRLLTEVHHQEDQYEAYGASFKAVAVARVVR